MFQIRLSLDKSLYALSVQRWLLQKTGLTISDLVTLQNFTIKQSAHTLDKSVQDSIASQSLESAVTAPSLGSVNSLQSCASDKSGSLPEDGVPALPSALSKKLDKFIRQGLSQQPLQPLPPSEPCSPLSNCPLSLALGRCFDTMVLDTAKTFLC